MWFRQAPTLSLVAWWAQEADVSSARAATREARARLPVLSPGETRWEQGGPDPKFEIRVPSHLAGGDFGCGVPKSPFVRPETGLGVPKGPKESQGSKGSLSRRDAVAKLPIWQVVLSI